MGFLILAWLAGVQAFVGVCQGELHTNRGLLVGSWGKYPLVPWGRTKVTRDVFFLLFGAIKWIYYLLFTHLLFEKLGMSSCERPLLKRLKAWLIRRWFLRGLGFNGGMANAVGKQWCEVCTALTISRRSSLSNFFTRGLFVFKMPDAQMNINRCFTLRLKLPSCRSSICLWSKNIHLRFFGF